MCLTYHLSKSYVEDHNTLQQVQVLMAHISITLISILFTACFLLCSQYLSIIPSSLTHKATFMFS